MTAAAPPRATSSRATSSRATSSTMLPPSSSLAGSAGHKFDPPTMLQGFVCHSRGVELREVTPSKVVARVRSKRTHDVTLVARAGKLVVACSCPARSFGRAVCKHAWAALLEVDRTGGLEDLRAVRGVLPVEAAPLDGEASALPAPPRPSARSRGPAKATKAPPKERDARPPKRPVKRRS